MVLSTYTVTYTSMDPLASSLNGISGAVQGPATHCRCLRPGPMAPDGRSPSHLFGDMCVSKRKEEVVQYSDSFFCEKNDIYLVAGGICDRGTVNHGQW